MVVDLTIAKKHIESLYQGTFNAFERTKVKNQLTGITDFIEQVYLVNQPCKLSFKQLNSSGEGVASSLSISMVLFFQPTITLSEGSKIIVNQNGKQYILKNSGIVRYGINHNEVELINWDGWA